mmetsp:Transcript_18893/g.24299  ORF Transcript_18893/g.24299 Transcript_18893/m.24299 type:complete len:158 (+) Transcript_18893:131-604(+)
MLVFRRGISIFFLVLLLLLAAVCSITTGSRSSGRSWRSSSRKSTVAQEGTNNDRTEPGIQTADFRKTAFIPRGGWFEGLSPFGYKITESGEEFLRIDGCAESDLGRFLASLKERKQFKTLKKQWLEVLRVSKTGQSMRIYRKMEEFIKFCLNAGFID